MLGLSDRNYDKPALVGLLVLVQTLALAPYLFECGLTYDGGLYAGLGWSLYNDYDYQFNGRPGDVPPGFPVLVVPFFALGEKGMYLVPLLSSFVLATSFFLIMKKRFGPFFGFSGALLVFTNPLVYVYSAYVLRDLPSLALVMFGYLLYDRLKGRPSWGMALLLGASMGMAFLVKYASILYLLPIILHGIYRRQKWFFGALLIAAIVALPWVFWSYEVHDTPLKEHSSEHLGSLSFDGSGIGHILKPFFSWPFIVAFFLFLAGVVGTFKNRGFGAAGSPFLLLFVFSLAAFLLWPIKSDRYLLPVVVPVAYFAVGHLSSMGKKFGPFLLILVVLSQFSGSVHQMETAHAKYVLLEDAGHWIRDNTPEDSCVMTQSFRQIAFYSHRQSYEVPQRGYVVRGFIKRYNVTHILVDSYEKTTPEYIRQIVNEEEYKIAARFDDGYGEVIIYEVGEL